MRSFAIIPAAGRSVRMGRPKLLLPWFGATVIETVLHAWLASRVDHVVVVVRSDDEELARACRVAMGPHAGERAAVVRPVADPPDMKASTAAGLRWISEHFRPAECDVWLLAPADLPTINRQAIDDVLAAAANQPDVIHVPMQGGRRGHPVVFPWRLAGEVERLEEGDGINRLLARHFVREVLGDSSERLSDLDTPADYARMVEQRERR